MATQTTTKRRLTKQVKTPATKAATAKAPAVARSYNRFKEYNGKAYTGMQIGRSHKWNYDKGVWRETKVTPDRWELTYDVVKRRAGHAPEGSGAAVGTGYHWFILSHQFVEKLNADDYVTSMVGVKFKLAHKRATKETWSVSDATQRKNLIQILKDFITELETEPQKSVPVPLHFEYKGKQFDGVGIPVMSSCHDGVCDQLDVTLNKKHLGVIKCTKNGWRLTDVPQGLTNTIGEKIFEWYE
jgi:hypothetical protein